jgi:hypothetical protein
MIIIIGNSIFFFEPSLENSAKFDPVLISLDLATLILFEMKVVSLASNTQPVGIDHSWS